MRDMRRNMYILIGVIIILTILAGIIPIKSDSGTIQSYSEAYETVGSKIELVCTYRVSDNYYTGIGASYCLRAHDFYKGEVQVKVTQTLLGAYVYEK